MTSNTDPPATAVSPAAARVLKLLDDSRLVVTVGSGGVGKTTTAAALAIAAARRGRKAAVLTIDPARRLAQALGVDKMGNEPRPLSAELTAPGSVDAMMLEAPEALDAFVNRIIVDEDRRQRLYQNRLYQVIARHLGGTHEYMAVERLHNLVEESGYDLVVLDTPPTVNALDFLDAPNRLSGFFSDKITRYFVKQGEERKKGFIDKLRDRAGDLALQVLGKAIGEGFVEELTDFATAFSGLFQAIHDRAVAADRILRSASTSFLIVSGADPVRTAEAEVFKATLERLGIHPRALVANRVHTAREGAVIVDEAALVAALAAAGRPADVQPAWEAVQATERLLSAVRARDARGLAHLQRIAGRDQLLVVSELDEEVQDRAAVEHFLGALG
ncbi:MAG: ArsA family ATPase, partial [Deltaproteobacteria bacterium]|nr:ArsA family ATPase [Deltaproteobacteria bacterium]